MKLIFRHFLLGLIVLSPISLSALSVDCDLLNVKATYSHVTRPQEIGSLRILSFNTNNLRMRVGKYEHVSVKKLKKLESTKDMFKSPEQLDQTIKMIKEVDPDIMILSEVESIHELRKINHDSLGNQYESLLIDGNDSRGIDIGLMVRRQLPFHAEYRTHKDMQWMDWDGKVGPVFTRDLPVLILRNSPFASDASMIIVGTHLKSKRDRAGDPGSTHWRKVQLEQSLEVVKQLKKEFGNEVPIIMGGDFNGDVRTSEIRETLGAVFKDAFDVATKTVPDPLRITHSFFPRGSDPMYGQLDGFLVSPSLTSRIREAEIYRWKDSSGKEIPIPENYEQRETLPSDHYPVVIDVNTDGLF